jgi:hypothetical protein
MFFKTANSPLSESNKIQKVLLWLSENWKEIPEIFTLAEGLTALYSEITHYLMNGCILFVS